MRKDGEKKKTFTFFANIVVTNIAIEDDMWIRFMHMMDTIFRFEMITVCTILFL